MRITRNRTPQNRCIYWALKIYVLNLKNTGKPACDFEIDLFEDNTKMIQYLATSTGTRTSSISQRL